MELKPGFSGNTLIPGETALNEIMNSLVNVSVVDFIHLFLELKFGSIFFAVIA